MIEEYNNSSAMCHAIQTKIPEIHMESVQIKITCYDNSLSLGLQRH